MTKPFYAQAWFWIFLVGLIVFIAAIVAYELTTDDQAISIWIWFFLFVALFLILGAFVVYVISNELVPAGILNLTPGK